MEKTQFWLPKYNHHNWGDQYNSCVKCGQRDSEHVAFGECNRCRKRRIRREGNITGIWSIKYAACVSCNSTERPHSAQGYCDKCWQAKRRRDRDAPIRSIGKSMIVCYDCKNLKPLGALDRCRNCYQNYKRKEARERKKAYLETCEMCGYCKQPIEVIEQAIDVLVEMRIRFFHRPCYHKWCDEWVENMKY